MSFLVYVNMQKRTDGKVYPDMHKTDGKIYFTPEEAENAILSDPALAHTRHVVAIECMVYEETHQNDTCPACGEDSGTRCGLPNCEY